MIGKIKLGQYIAMDSLIHRLDPRCKILATILMMVTILYVDSFYSFYLLFLLLLMTTFLSKISIKVVLKSVKPIMLLIIFTAILHLFGADGEKIISIGKIGISYQGIILAVKMSLKLFLLVVFASFLVLTTSPVKLSDGLEMLFTPLKKFGFPAHESAMMMTIALRFIPTLFEETEKIIEAQTSRGANFSTGGIIKRTKAYIPLLIPVFVMLFQRADTLATAMEARHYRGGVGRTRMYPLKWSANDTISLFILIIFSLILLIINGVH
ncbi:MAG: energy-coupling factor transporter transmembrane protein EcfT [Synergistaceae bacterium]